MPSARPIEPSPSGIMHLYETHLPVANTEISKDFYTEIVGLPFRLS